MNIIKYYLFSTSQNEYLNGMLIPSNVPVEFNSEFEAKAFLLDRFPKMHYAGMLQKRGDASIVIREHVTTIYTKQVHINHKLYSDLELQVKSYADRPSDENLSAGFREAMEAVIYSCSRSGFGIVPESIRVFICNDPRVGVIRLVNMPECMAENPELFMDEGLDTKNPDILSTLRLLSTDEERKKFSL